MLKFFVTTPLEIQTRAAPIRIPVTTRTPGFFEKLFYFFHNIIYFTVFVLHALF